MAQKCTKAGVHMTLALYSEYYNRVKFKGVVHFKKKTFADNLLAPMSSKMSMSFFLF